MAESKAIRSQTAERKRRRLSLSWLGLAGPIAIALVLGYIYQQKDAVDLNNYTGRTERILKITPLIDGHNDLPYLLRLELLNRTYDTDKLTFRQSLASHTDLQRIEAGRIGGQFWSIFIECPDITNTNNSTHSVRDTIEQIDVAKRFIAEQPEFKYCETSGCVMKAFNAGRIPSMLGAECLHQTGNSIAAIRQLFELGVR